MLKPRTIQDNIWAVRLAFAISQQFPSSVLNNKILLFQRFYYRDVSSQLSFSLCTAQLHLGYSFF